MPDRKPDWDPRATSVLSDQEVAYDDMRKRCPVAYSEFAGWSLFRHEDVVRVLEDYETFSNVVSAHRSYQWYGPARAHGYAAPSRSLFSGTMVEFAPIAEA